MSLYILTVHIVVRTYANAPLLTPEAEDHLAVVLKRRLAEMGGRLLAANGMPNHQHWLAELPVDRLLIPMIHTLKSQTAIALNRSGLLRERFQWRRGAAVFSVNAREHKRLLAYIRDQKQHHAANTTVLDAEPDWDDED